MRVFFIGRESDLSAVEETGIAPPYSGSLDSSSCWYEPEYLVDAVRQASRRERENGEGVVIYQADIPNNDLYPSRLVGAHHTYKVVKPRIALTLNLVHMKGDR